MSKNFILSFGSLRKTSSKGYNFDRFGKGSQKYIKDVWLDGWDMFSLINYPAIAKGAGKIKCELQEVSKDAYEKICGMERSAGYQETQIDVDGIKATLFYMDAKDLQGRNLVTGGDWS